MRAPWVSGSRCGDGAAVIERTESEHAALPPRARDGGGERVLLRRLQLELDELGGHADRDTRGLGGGGGGAMLEYGALRVGIVGTQALLDRLVGDEEDGGARNGLATAIQTRG
jgi:hypothetical protein